MNDGTKASKQEAERRRQFSDSVRGRGVHSSKGYDNVDPDGESGRVRNVAGLDKPLRYRFSKGQRKDG